MEFQADTLDDRGWVVDFGGLKQIKSFLVDHFDHKTIVAKDDPLLEDFLELHEKALCDLVIMDAVGCERFAEEIFKQADAFINRSEYAGRVRLKMVEVMEHPGNSAICEA